MNENESSSNQNEITPKEEEFYDLIGNQLFPALKKYSFIAPNSLLESGILKIADLPELYKVFERC